MQPDIFASTSLPVVMLREFCNWQKKRNRDVHYDTAILLTR